MSKGPQKKNIAIIFHGLVHRSLKFTITSFEEKLLKPLQKKYNVDVYHHSWVVEKINNPRAGENNISVDTDAIQKYLPYSQGIEEDQNEFDATIDPSFFNENNPMHRCNATVEGAYCTAMNSLRDLESTKRAFMFMEKCKKVDYDYVIVCRPDVEFLGTVKVSTIKKMCKKGVIGVPLWRKGGGVNDRWAIGEYEDIRIYCMRIHEALDWMISGIPTSSEQYLEEYLLSKNLAAKVVPIYFRTIRATGEISQGDIISKSTSPIINRLKCYSPINALRLYYIIFGARIIKDRIKDFLEKR